MAQRFRLPSDSLLNDSANPLAGGTLTFYETGTSTPLATYSDNSLSTSNSNPITLDAAGRHGDIFLQALTYKVILKDASGTTIKTMDPVVGGVALSDVVGAGTAASHDVGDFAAPGANSDITSLSALTIPVASFNINHQDYLSAGYVNAGGSTDALFSDLQDAVDAGFTSYPGRAILIGNNGSWSRSTALKIHPGQTVMGMGNHRSCGGITLAAAANCNIIELSDTTPAGEDISISNLYLNGNKSAQTSGTVQGLYLNLTNSATGIGRIFVDRVFIESCYGKGIYTQGYGRGSFFSNIEIYDVDGVGWHNEWSDCHFANIDIGDTGLQGALIKAGGVWTNTKIWKAGLVTAGSGVGVYIQQADGVRFDGWVQDCASYGVYVNGTSGAPVAHCNIKVGIDSCASYGVGITDYVNNNVIEADVWNRSGGLYTTSRCFRMVGTPTGINNNRLIANPTFDATLAYAFDPATNWAGTNKLEIGNQPTGSVATTYASTITPNVQNGQKYIAVTLTGNVTIANPTTAYDGAELTLSLTQDATGTRTTTFGSAFSANWTPDTTASKTNVIMFRYSALSSKWRQVSAATGL